MLLWHVEKNIYAKKLCRLFSVRDTSSNDTSSTATLRRKFLSNYQFVEK